MRLVRGSIVSLSLVVLVIACNTVDADQCWPNTSGGFGGSETLPIGAAVGAGSGDFASPPAGGPLDYGGVANPCIEPQDACNTGCESNYSNAAAKCGRIEDAAQRKACQDSAYATYKSCRASCPQSSDDCRERCKKQCDKIHDRCHADCTKNNPTSGCHAKCNDQYGGCLKECDRDCKGK